MAVKLSEIDPNWRRMRLSEIPLTPSGAEKAAQWSMEDLFDSPQQQAELQQIVNRFNTPANAKEQLDQALYFNKWLGIEPGKAFSFAPTIKRVAFEDKPLPKLTRLEDAEKALKELPRNLRIGMLNLSRGEFEAIKATGMRLSGGGIFPDEDVRRMFEMQPAAKEPFRPRKDDPLYFLRPSPEGMPLPGAIGAEALGIVTRLPDIGSQIVKRRQEEVVREQERVTLANAPITRLMRPVVQNAGILGTTIGLGVLTGDPVLALGFIGSTTFGNAFAEQIEAGGSIGKSFFIADLSAAAEIGGEMLVLPKVIKGFDEGVTFRQLFNIFAENAGQEGVTEFVQTFTETVGILTTQNTPLVEASKIGVIEAVKAVPEAMFVGGVLGAGAGSVAMGFGYMRNKISEGRTDIDLAEVSDEQAQAVMELMSDPQKLADAVGIREQADRYAAEAGKFGRALRAEGRQLETEAETRAEIEDRRFERTIAELDAINEEHLEQIAVERREAAEPAIPQERQITRPEPEGAAAAPRAEAAEASPGAVAEVTEKKSETLAEAQRRVAEQRAKGEMTEFEKVNLRQRLTELEQHRAKGVEALAAARKFFPENVEKIEAALQETERQIDEIRNQLAGGRATEAAPEVAESLQEQIAEREAGLSDEQLSGISKSRRRSLIKNTQKAILTDPVYQIEVDALGREIDKFAFSSIAVGKGFAGEVAQAIESHPILKGRISLEPTFTSKHWDAALAEIGEPDMDIGELLDRMGTALEARQGRGVLNETAMDLALESGNPFTEIQITKNRLLRQGMSDIQINQEILDIAERYDMEADRVIDDLINPAKIKELAKMDEGLELDRELERLAEEQIIAEEQMEAQQAAKEVLKANGIEAEVEIVEDIELPDDIPFERRDRAVGAAMSRGQKELILLAYGADSRTGYHEGYHLIRPRLTIVDIAILEQAFPNEEAEASAFGEFMQTGKAASLIRRVFAKLKAILDKVRSTLQGKGFRTPEDIFGEIAVGRVQLIEATTQEAVQFEIKPPLDKNPWELTQSEWKAYKSGLSAEEFAQKKNRFIKDNTYQHYLQISVTNNKNVPIAILEQFQGQKWAVDAIEKRKLEKPTTPIEWERIGRNFTRQKRDGFSLQVAFQRAVDAKNIEMAKELKKQLELAIGRLRAAHNEVLTVPGQQPGDALDHALHAYNRTLRKLKKLEEFKNLPWIGANLFEDQAPTERGVKFETSGERLRRETEHRARVKARKARLAEQHKRVAKPKKKKKGPSIRRTKIRLQDTTPPLRADLAPPEPAKPSGVLITPAPPTPKTRVGKRVMTDELLAEQRGKAEGVWREAASDKARNTALGLEKRFEAMSARLGRIHPKPKYGTRQYVFDHMVRTVEFKRATAPMVLGLKKFGDDDASDFKFLVRNSSFVGAQERIEALVVKYGLTDEWEAYREAMDRIYDMAEEVGLDMGKVRNYWPRTVKNLRGLLRWVDTQEKNSPIQRALAKRSEQAGGRKLTAQEKAQVINTLLRGFRIAGVSLSRPGQTKERTIEFYDKQIDRYYYGLGESVENYIVDMMQNIGAREFFGKQTREITNLQAQRSRLATRLHKVQTRVGYKQVIPSERHEQHISRAAELLKEVTAELEKRKGRTIEDSIGYYVQDLQLGGFVTADEQQQIGDMLRAIMEPEGLTGWARGFVKLAYLDVLNNMPVAMTQLEELGYSFHKDKIRALPAAMQAALGKSGLKLDELGIDDINQYMRDLDFSRLADMMLFMMRAADRFGKQTFINTTVANMRAEASRAKPKAEFVNKLTEIFGPETQEVIEDLKAGRISDNVKFLAFNELADVQPIAITETPEAYARGRNWRLAYVLRQFTLKRFSYMRGIAQDKMSDPRNKPKQFVQGLKMLTELIFILTLFGVGKDAIKDWFLGKEFDLSDSVVENLLQFLLLSRYTTDKLAKQGPSEAIWGELKLPAKTPDAIWQDVRKGEIDRTVRSIPFIGENYYWWFGGGSENGGTSGLEIAP